jgi:hypothetical protein
MYKKEKRGNLNSLLIPRIRLSHCLPSKDKQCRSPRYMYIERISNTYVWTSTIALPCGGFRSCEVLYAADKTLSQRLSIKIYVVLSCGWWLTMEYFCTRKLSECSKMKRKTQLYNHGIDEKHKTFSFEISALSVVIIFNSQFSILN